MICYFINHASGSAALIRSWLTLQIVFVCYSFFNMGRRLCWLVSVDLLVREVRGSYLLGRLVLLLKRWYFLLQPSAELVGCPGLWWPAPSLIRKDLKSSHKSPPSSKKSRGYSSKIGWGRNACWWFFGERCPSLISLTEDASSVPLKTSLTRISSSNQNSPSC